MSLKTNLMDKKIFAKGRTNPRHYQSIDAHELKIRKKENLVYIKKYFMNIKNG